MAVLLTSLESGVLTLSLNRPDKFNSFTREMALALVEAIEGAKHDDEVRAIVLTGIGKAFCAGQDLGEAISLDGPSIETIVEEHYNPIVLGIRAIEKPVIAAVNGVAAGAGANIAIACDVCIAAESASFIQAFSKIGLLPDSAGTFFLPRVIGFQKASALMMLGDKISAKEAEGLGMIYKCVADDAFQETLNKLASKMAAMPTKAFGHPKRALNASMNNTLEQQLVLEGQLQTELSKSYDYKEGVEAFLEKRKPEFKGK